MMSRFLTVITLQLSLLGLPLNADESPTIRESTAAAMKKAATYYREQVASHGGYVYLYSLDLERRWGEGVATKDQIWVQPPGTPTVGMAYLKAYEVTRDDDYLEAATAAAESLLYGQLKSGGWTNWVDFDPHGSRTADYRNGKGRGKDNSSLDDGQTQSAIRLLMHVDKAHGFSHSAIHESVTFALDALLAAQFANGGFPQVWSGPVPSQPVIKASYPDGDWRTEGRIKEYWHMYTLNDNVCGHVADTLIDAYRIYDDKRYLDSLRKLADFLILAQMPQPQPAWAQQYNYEMKPIWARKFEPPAISGGESQEVIETLIRISVMTGDRRYLEPIPRALGYFKRSMLADGRLARFYELKTNTPLYMYRRGSVYTLTYDDSDLPTHYSWKRPSRIAELESDYKSVLSRGRLEPRSAVTPAEVRRILAALDEQGRWVSTRDAGRLAGGVKMPQGTRYLSSKLFSDNLSKLASFLQSQ